MALKRLILVYMEENLTVVEGEKYRINSVNSQYTLNILKSVYKVKASFKLNDLELRILLLLYSSPGLSQYKVHLGFYGADNNISYTTTTFKKLFDAGYLEIVGYSVRAALFGLTDKGVEVVNAVFDGVDEDL